LFCSAFLRARSARSASVRLLMNTGSSTQDLVQRLRCSSTGAALVEATPAPRTPARTSHRRSGARTGGRGSRPPLRRKDV
jgi:hypothetical protein